LDTLQQVNGINPFGMGFNTQGLMGGFSPGAAASRCAGGCCGGGMPMGGLDSMGAISMMMYQNQMLTQLLQMLMGLMSGQGQNNPFSPASTGGGGSSPSGGGGSSPSGGGSSSSGAGAGAADPSQFSGGTDTGRKLAAEAQKEATNGDSSGGWCFRDAGRALAKVGINTSGASAYMAADQLAKNPKVKEIKVSQGDLPKLPPGAIVVWDKGPGHEHGHISIALGNGKEASDLVRNQITNYGTSFRVFMPV
jgi:hypothetical protein